MRCDRQPQLPTGLNHVMASGVLPENPVRFSRAADGMRWLEIQDIETVRWTGRPD